MGLRDRLDSTRQAAKERKAGSTRLFKWAIGKTKFRFVPGVEDESEFYAEYGLHWLKDENGSTVGAVGDASICYGRDDIVRDGLLEVRRYASQTEDEALEERVNDMLAKRRYIAAIQVIEAPGEVPEEPVLADFPQGVFEAILSMMEDVFNEADNDEEATSQLIGDDAIVFQIERSGTGKNTEYSQTMTRKTASLPKGASEQIPSVKDWIAAQFDSSKIAQAAKLVSQMLGRPLDDSVIEGALASSSSQPAITDQSKKSSIADELDDEIPLDGASEDSEEADEAADPSTVEGGDDVMAEIDNL